jgi:thiamine biosynthesis lipoprotein
MHSLSRRRFLQVIAATSVSGLATLRASAADDGTIRRWDGEALGADASISLFGLEPDRAEPLLRACRDEIVRLEAVFSLYRETSALTRLNAHGFLADPPMELTDLLDTCRSVFALSNGAFDPTVQPLWRLYAETHGDPLSPRAPEPSEVAARLGLIGFGAVSWNRRRVTLGRPGMAITLNGIAQGAITDRITTVLRGGGVPHALVNVGEYSGLGHHPEGRPWQVGIQDPRNAGAIADHVDLVDQCVATSGAYGGRFGDSGLNHIIDPRNGRSPERYLSVSVRHTSATLADGLSTAFSFMSEGEIAAASRCVGGVSAILIRADGTTSRI